MISSAVVAQTKERRLRFLYKNSEYQLLSDFPNGRLEWRVYTSGTPMVVNSANSSVSGGNWYFVEVWHDSVTNMIGIRLNNGTAVTAAHSTGVTDGTGTLHFGAGLSFASDSKWDEVAYWTKLLTSQDCTDLYNSGNGIACSSYSGGGAATIKGRRQTMGFGN